MADYIRIESDRRGFSPIENDILDNETLLTGMEKLMYIMLLRYGEKVFPSVGTLARKCSISRPTATKVLDSLVKKGLVVKHARTRKDGGQDSNLYTVFNTREIWASKTLEEVNAAISMTELEKAKRLLESAGYVVADVPPSEAPQPDSKPKPTGKRKTAQKLTKTATDATGSPDAYTAALEGLRLVTGGEGAGDCPG